MNEESNVPVASGSTGMAGWFSTWMTAVTKPNEQTYATLAQHPDATSNNRAFIWVFIAGTISALVSGVLGAILGLVGFSAPTGGLADLYGVDASRGVAFTFGVAICSAPITGALGVLFFAIFTGIVQWVARLFKGTGTFSQLAYVFAAISVPFTLVTSLLSPFSVIPYVGYCVNGISLLLGLYVLVLELMAVKGVNKFGWGEAAGSVFLPLLFFVCCAVLAGIALGTLSVAVLETFNEINQNIP
jgi:hypothetical protein